MIDINKKYRTRDGKNVRVLCVDLGSMQPVVAAVTTEKGEQLELYCLDGCYFVEGGPNPRDLVEAPKTVKVEVWMNVYPGGACYGPYPNKECADLSGTSNRLACIHIEREVDEGEGL
jgi:hypothetical protein